MERLSSKPLSSLSPHATDSSFEADVLQAEKPVLVDFWAPWCGPCHAIAPVLEDLSNEMAAELKVIKINVDENPDITGQMGVRSIPTLIMFKNGERVARHSGATSLGQLKAFVQSNV